MDKNNFVVYGSRNCPYTVKALDHLKKNGMKVTFKDTGKLTNQEDIARVNRAATIQRTGPDGRSTIPKVFRYNENTNDYSYMGGCKEVVNGV